MSSTKSNGILPQLLVLLATIVTIAFNGISQSLPIGGQTSADVSNHYATYFTPANYAFAIWQAQERASPEASQLHREP